MHINTEDGLVVYRDHNIQKCVFHRIIFKNLSAIRNMKMVIWIKNDSLCDLSQTSHFPFEGY